ncbi:MAG: hypothetical protein OEL89_01385 [Candidatus Peregrinibacteria bacterium]|nr:hypothetical protein [Candidatus Peregrinibacteria bacterium]
MIIDAKIVNKPNSGEFEERVYDNESPCNSQNWTWVKFLENDGKEWVGNFRGSGHTVSLSKVLNEIFILTNNYILRISAETGDIIEIKDSPQYRSVTVSPNGNIVLADYYSLVKVGSNFTELEDIPSPFQMDMIEFKEWTGDKLKFSCDEFLNKYRKNVRMELDSKTWEIKEFLDDEN